jgi:lipopolysaccharide/colanic/teichoic acid biosynthesis glycosyltransferase
MSAEGAMRSQQAHDLRSVESLVDRYARHAREWEHRPVDAMQRGFDLVLGSFALVVCLPLIALIALGIRLTSGAPVLYRGARVGRAGRLFTMYKFRTLAADAETRLAPYLGHELTALTATEYTRLGRLLRASKLDELPQFYNVVHGHMSLVGPRPIRPWFFEELCSEIPQYWQRLVVRPGVTGLAQLRLEREMTWAEKLAHDLEYIADRSARLYLAVLWDTVRLLAGLPLARRRRRAGAPSADHGT